jgi:hypothetical protein
MYKFPINTNSYSHVSTYGPQFTQNSESFLSKYKTLIIAIVLFCMFILFLMFVIAPIFDKKDDNSVNKNDNAINDKKEDINNIDEKEDDDSTENTDVVIDSDGLETPVTIIPIFSIIPPFIEDSVKVPGNLV